MNGRTLPFEVYPKHVSLFHESAGPGRTVAESVSDAWLIENFDPDVPRAAEEPDQLQ